MLLRHDGFRKLCEARALLRDVSDDAPTIERVATIVGISRAHFISQFEALFGLTPHQYRIEARLELARNLLAHGDKSVTDVCLDVGMTSLGSFSRSFTRRVGESPSAYRRRRQSAAAAQPTSGVGARPGCLTLLAHLPHDRTFGEPSRTSRRHADRRPGPACESD
ncbi:MAG: helix-turn-helix transcriptional regulator [Gemmatimonadaceae bacterium]